MRKEEEIKTLSLKEFVNDKDIQALEYFYSYQYFFDKDGKTIARIMYKHKLDYDKERDRWNILTFLDPKKEVKVTR